MNKFLVAGYPATDETKNGKFVVYRLSFFDIFYFGRTANFDIRLKSHLSFIKKAIQSKGETKSSILFHNEVAAICLAKRMSYSDCLKNISALVLSRFNDEVSCILKEESIIIENIDNPFCKNILTMSRCKYKGMRCIDEIVVDGKLINPSFCVNCGNSIKQQYQ